MKRNLILLTGIVFLITILAASGCKNKPTYGGFIMPPPDSTKVIYLKDTAMNGRVHLEMYNERDPDTKVIDSLYTGVNPGYTVIWKKAKGSNIQKIHDIHPIDDDGAKFFKYGVEEIEVAPDTILHKLKIPIDTQPDTIKYEIVFSLQHHGGSWCVDPFLQLPEE